MALKARGMPPICTKRRCRANLVQIRQTRPDSGLGLSHFQYESLSTRLTGSLLARQRYRKPCTPLSKSAIPKRANGPIGRAAGKALGCRVPCVMFRVSFFGFGV